MPQFLRLRSTKKPRRAPRGQEIVYLDRADGVIKSVDDTGAANAFSGGGGGGSVTVSGSQSGSVADVTEIKVAGAVSDLGSGVAGQGLVLQLLTFTVNFDDVGILDYTRVLWTPAAGDVIVDLWCEPIIQFAGADSALLYIGGDSNFDGLIQGVTGGTTPDLIPITPAAGSADFGLQNTAFSNWSLDARLSHIGMTANGDAPVGRTVVALPAITAANGTNVIFALNVTNGPLTAGRIKVYAIIATPAA